MRELETYLRRATGGLWGRHKALVREELEGHLLERAERYRMAGLDEDAAIRRAIAEMGDSGAVSRGMFRVYTVPVLAGSSLALAVLVSAVMLLLPASIAQVAVTRDAPKPFCTTAAYTQDCILDSGQSWIDISSLKEVLGRQGVTVEDQGGWVDISIPGVERIQVIRAYAGNNLGSFTRNGKSYVEDSYFVQTLGKNIVVPTTIKGLYNPRITVGKVSFVLGDDKARVDARSYYFGLLVPDLWKAKNILSYMPAWRPETGAGTRPFEVSTRATAGTVYGVVSCLDTATDPSGEIQCRLYDADIAETGPDGKLRFSARRFKLEFTDSLEALASTDPFATTKAVLIRFTGRIDLGSKNYEIEVPEQRGVESVR